MKIKEFDTAEYLTNEQEIALYLEDILESGDPKLIAHALGNIAKARGMTELAKQTGIKRESLYKSLSSTGNPEFGTILKVLKALNIRLHTEVIPV